MEGVVYYQSARGLMVQEGYQWKIADGISESDQTYIKSVIGDTVLTATDMIMFWMCQQTIYAVMVYKYDTEMIGRYPMINRDIGHISFLYAHKSLYNVAFIRFISTGVLPRVLKYAAMPDEVETFERLGFSVHEHELYNVTDTVDETNNEICYKISDHTMYSQILVPYYEVKKNPIAWGIISQKVPMILYL